MKAKTRSQLAAKQIAELLVKEWHASHAKKAVPQALSSKTTATGRGLVKFHGLRVLENYRAPRATRVATTKRGTASD